MNEEIYETDDLVPKNITADENQKLHPIVIFTVCAVIIMFLIPIIATIVDYNKNPEKLIVGTWEYDEGFIAFEKDNSFTGDLSGTPVGDGSYTISSNESKNEYEIEMCYTGKNGSGRRERFTITKITKDTLVFAYEGETVMVFSKKK